MWLRCFWNAALCLHMRLAATGKNVLRPWLRTNGGENDEVKPGDPGRWMRRPSRFMESGALSSGPLMLMAIWLMRD